MNNLTKEIPLVKSSFERLPDVEYLAIYLIFSFSLLNLPVFEVGTVEYQNPLFTKKEMTQGLYHSFYLIVNLETVEYLEIELRGIS